MKILSPEIKPNLRTTQLIARIERLSGSWDRAIELNSSFEEIYSEKKAEALEKNTLATLCLDNTTPAPLSHPILGYFNSKTPLDLPKNSILSEDCLQHLRGLRLAFDESVDLSQNGLLKLHKLLTGNFEEEKYSCSELSLKSELSLRVSPSTFFSHNNSRIFETVSPFLVSRRFREILEWANEEFYNGETHPLLVIGTLHLLLLQLHPFKSANHRLVLITSWHLIRERGYEWISYSNLWSNIASQSEGYYNALKHAEKTAYSDWSTLNIWLELFLKNVFHAALETAGNIGIKTPVNAPLSETQLRILEVIKNHGSLSRDKLVIETGISPSTIKYNLGLLAEKGHLIREGGGRSTYYRAG
ncbi:MAG TPA: winged helix-turn-helix transcriptional regulator [Oligoflexia bacterium]|nr:winged helix-turn-helix transcriptional regulator [Oligoflexia bacterium]HMP48158.1 winged helix-turn-helix transcriptional regulator [Oligoflexia bacterium]